MQWGYCSTRLRTESFWRELGVLGGSSSSGGRVRVGPHGRGSGAGLPLWGGGHCSCWRAQGESPLGAGPSQFGWDSGGRGGRLWSPAR